MTWVALTLVSKTVGLLTSLVVRMMPSGAVSSCIPQKWKGTSMLKVSSKVFILAVLSQLFWAQPVFSAPLIHWRFPFRLHIPVPLRIVERFREQRVPLRPEPEMAVLAGLSWHTSYSEAWREA